MTVFGEGKDEFTSNQQQRMQELGKIIVATATLNGFSNWEMMAACGTLYVNYLRNSEKRDMAIRDAEQLVEALKY